jgi:hypothetical protein
MGNVGDSVHHRLCHIQHFLCVLLAQQPVRDKRGHCTFSEEPGPCGLKAGGITKGVTRGEHRRAGPAPLQMRSRSLCKPTRRGQMVPDSSSVSQRLPDRWGDDARSGREFGREVIRRDVTNLNGVDSLLGQDVRDDHDLVPNLKLFSLLQDPERRL